MIRRQSWDGPTIERLLALQKSGLTQPQIAEALGMGIERVRDKIHNMKRARAPLKLPFAWTDEAKARLLSLIRDDGLSAGLAAKAMGISKGTVMRATKKFGIQLNERAKPDRPPRVQSPVVSRLPTRPVFQAPAPRAVFDRITPGTRCTWLDGEPRERRFCNDPCLAKSSYCPAHHARCYVPRQSSPAPAVEPEVAAAMGGVSFSV